MSVSLELVSQITEALKSGTPPETIKAALLESGSWSEEDITTALERAGAMPQASTAKQPAISQAPESATPRATSHQHKNLKPLYLVASALLMCVGLGLAYLTITTPLGQQLQLRPVAVDDYYSTWSNLSAFRYNLTLTGNSTLTTDHFDPLFTGSLSPELYQRLDTSAPERPLAITTQLEISGVASKELSSITEGAGQYRLRAKLIDTTDTSDFNPAQSNLDLQGNYRFLKNNLYLTFSNLPRLEGLKTDYTSSTWWQTTPASLLPILDLSSTTLLGTPANLISLMQASPARWIGLNTIDETVVEHVQFDINQPLPNASNLTLTTAEIWVEPKSQRVLRAIVRGEEVAPEDAPNPQSHTFILDIAFTEFDFAPRIDVPDFVEPFTNLIIPPEGAPEETETESETESEESAAN